MTEEKRLDEVDSDLVIEHLREIQCDYENNAYVSGQLSLRRSVTINNAIALIEDREVVKGQLEAAESLMEFNDD